MVFGLGDAGIKIHIEIQPSLQSMANGTVVPISHRPSWRVTKNPFHTGLAKFAHWKEYHQRIHPNYNAAICGGGGGGMNNMPQYPMHHQAQFQPQLMQPQLMQQQEGEVLYAYGENEDVQGVVHLILPHGRKFEHLGVKIQFVGRVDVSQAILDGRSHHDFISHTKELQPPCTLYQSQTSLPFYFRTDAKPFESYHGRNVNVRYFVRVLVERKFLPAIKQDKDVLVQLLRHEPRLNEPIKMEVGIEECLHIEFQYQKRYYHLNDCIEGNIHFMLVRIKIKYMELAVLRRESSGDGILNSKPGGIGQGTETGGGSVVTETQTLTRFEIMDGAPVKGEVIPVRLYLSGIPADLTPTYDSPNSRFSVRYYLNLVLVDEEDRRYFKQQEIFLWRKELG
mmetsp:Transcript_17370/g.32935  ORF Transcript_17370/g.32935 Transcript_17370/m.32935 type:complete len:394 (+) Transcript_17370:189-1370(+)|eukprot:CAMPEP_0176485922 /NCGR_PEP_ID=MMETSP0200_2-20121128/5297_1 /TAXON_ID=947934 /ORGANISM="Chaetoceros sp., Strain GSL56" /LENGTH=393 /DNA_ID=CAMNT_0017882597 /DNA_START=90 /DNA_END=1271 /DNA_ORIENTATION=-